MNTPVLAVFVCAALCGCSNSSPPGAGSNQPSARASVAVAASGAASVAAPSAAPSSGVAASSAPSSSAAAVASNGGVPSSGSGTCKPFGANFTNLGTSCHGVQLWAPTSKAALPPAASWKACDAAAQRGGAVPTVCEALDTARWVADGNQLYLANPQIEFAGDSPRLSMEVIAAGCSSWIAIDADGAPVSAAIFRGNLQSKSLAAGGGVSWLGMLVDKSSDPSAGGEPFGCYFVAREDVMPPGSTVGEFAAALAWKPDALSAQVYVDSDTINTYADAQTKLPPAIAVAAVGDIAVRLSKSKLEVVGMDGKATTLVEANPGDVFIRVAANTRWIVWTLERGKDVVLTVLPFSRSASATGPVELSSWPIPPEGKYPTEPETPLLGPDHVLANRQLFQLRDGARWTLPFWSKQRERSMPPKLVGVTATHVYWTDADLLRTPIASLGDPTPKP